MIEEKEGYIYGIYWTRDEPIFPIHGDEVTWYTTYAEARREYDERDDKYWPSVFMEGSVLTGDYEVGVYPYG